MHFLEQLYSNKCKALICLNILCWLMLGPCLGADDGLPRVGPLNDSLAALPLSLQQLDAHHTETLQAPLLRQTGSDAATTLDDDALKQQLDDLFIHEPYLRAQKIQGLETYARLGAAIVGVAPANLLCGIFMYHCGDFLRIPPPGTPFSDFTAAFVTGSLTVYYVSLSMELMSSALNSYLQGKFPDLLYSKQWYHKAMNFTAFVVKGIKGVLWLRKAFGIEAQFSIFFWLTAPPFLLIDTAMNYRLARRGMDGFTNKFVYSKRGRFAEQKTRLVANAKNKARSTLDLTGIAEGQQTPGVSQIAKLLEEKRESQGSPWYKDRYKINMMGRVAILPGYLLTWQWVFTADDIPVSASWLLASIGAGYSFISNGEWLVDLSALPRFSNGCAQVAYGLAVYVPSLVTGGVWLSLQAIYMAYETYKVYAPAFLWGSIPLAIVLALPPLLEGSKALTVTYEVINESLKRLTYNCQPPETQRQSRFSRIVKGLRNKLVRLQDYCVDKLFGFACDTSGFLVAVT